MIAFSRPRAHTPDLTGGPDEPWWTRGAIAWMEERLAASMDVLEWGAGASTVWLARRVGSVLAVEHDPAWASRVTEALAGYDPARYRVVQRPLDKTYYSIGGLFDAAIVDGRLRVGCCYEAMAVLKPGGILLLDNAERPNYAPARQALADWPVTRTDNGVWRTDIWIKP